MDLSILNKVRRVSGELCRYLRPPDEYTRPEYVETVSGLSVPLNVIDNRRAHGTYRDNGRRRNSFVQSTRVFHIRGGDIMYAGLSLGNLTPDEGEEWYAATCFDTDHASAGVPLNYGMGLLTIPLFGAEVEGNTLDASGTQVTEHAASAGYGRKSISSATGFTVSLDAGDYQAKTAQQTWTATGTWSTIHTIMLCTDPASGGTAGVIVGIIQLQASRDLVNNDQLNADMTVKFKEGV